MERRKVALIKGDGTGPELVESMLKVVNSVDVDLDLIPCPAGLEWWENNGGPSFIPEETWYNIKHSDACFKGTTTTSICRYTPNSFGTRSVDIFIRSHQNWRRINISVILVH